MVEVDLGSGAHKTAEFLALNPFGQVPVLDDDGTIIADSNAILVYLATKFGRTDWLPQDAKGAATVQRWLSVAAGDLAFGAAAARLISRSASARCALSIILPRMPTTPASGCARNAAMISSASAVSASVGVNTSLMMATWFGW
ncbi:glutathione S-transferase family protein, partial [Klebsiella pneumoniae]